jgi:hypothetical protein
MTYNEGKPRPRILDEGENFPFSPSFENALFYTIFSFSWQHRCVAILSTAYHWGTFIEAEKNVFDNYFGTQKN